MQENHTYPPSWLDLDVFTRYKAEHQRGLTVAEYVAFRPWLDSLGFLRTSYTTNESLSPLDADNVKIHVGWKQLLGPVQFDCTYRYHYFFADNDRKQPDDRKFLELGLKADVWLRNQQRVQGKVLTEIDLDKKQYSGFLSLSWFFGQGRGVRDFRPSELDFPEIKTRRVPQIINNRILPLPESVFPPVLLGVPNKPPS
jgi:hypothetical protein